MRARWLSACSSLVFLCASSSLPAASPNVASPGADAVRVRAPDELREAIRAAMKRTNSMAERSVADRLDEPALLELVDLYRALEKDAQLPVTERDSLSSQLRIRLQRIGKTIERRVQRTAKARTGKTTVAKTSLADRTSSNSVTGAAGGGPVDHGQELLNLIKATIAPDSWDDQGGNGTIFYWPAWHVLVIRQTDEVHEQIEGLLKALR
jgi:hypothetical protein